MNDVAQSAKTNPESLIPWIVEARAILGQSDWSPILTVAGCDSFDALLSPVYSALLAAIRAHGDKPENLWNRIRSLTRGVAYQAKKSLRDLRARRKSSVGQSVEILFWPRDRTHVVNQMPVARVLMERGVQTQFVTCQPQVFDQVHKEMPNTVYLPAVSPQAIRNAVRDGRRRSVQLRTAKTIDLQPLPGRPDLPVAEIIRGVMIAQLETATRSVALAQIAIEKFSPRLLVVGYDITMEGRIGCLVAKQCGLPSATMMHGSVTADRLQSCHIANRLLAYGEASREELIRQGADANQIAVCGAPYLDQRQQQTGKPHPLIQQRFGITENRPYILVATSGAGHRVSLTHHQKIIQNLLRLSTEFPDVTIVAKLHPKDRAQFYELAKSQFPQSRLHVVPHGMSGLPTNIFDWLQGASAAITTASSSGVEAMLMDVPVITIDFAGELSGVDFIAAGATTHATDFEALHQAVVALGKGHLMSSQQRQRAAQYLDSCFANLGEASQRSAEALLDLTNNPLNLSPQKVSAN